MPENVVVFKIDLPDEVLARLQQVIEKTVVDVLEKHVAKIQASPKKLTRRECADVLKISLPTVDKLLSNGEISCERAGKRVLIPEPSINAYLQSNRRA